MTKESLLDQHLKYAWECDENAQVIPYSEAEKAIDEFAKQFCEKLIGWLNDNDFRFSSYKDNMQSDHVNNGTRMHASEIIDLFIEHQNKEK